MSVSSSYTIEPRLKLYRSRQQPLDEDAPPTQSVFDEINNIPMSRDVRRLGSLRFLSY
jgi:hypothetical protein